MTKLTDGCGKEFVKDLDGYTTNCGDYLERTTAKGYTKTKYLCPECLARIEGYNLAKKEDEDKLIRAYILLREFKLTESIRGRIDEVALIYSAQFDVSVNEAKDILEQKRISAISAEINSDGGKD